MPLQSAQQEAAVFDEICTSLPAVRGKRRSLAPSIFNQLDGVCHSILGMRLERDVLARSADYSGRPVRGPPDPFIPLSAFDGLYFGPAAILPAVVAAVASHHGRGVFIVCKNGDVGPTIGRIHGHKRSTKAAPLPWLEYLRKHTVLEVELPGDCFTGCAAPSRNLWHW